MASTPNLGLEIIDLTSTPNKTVKDWKESLDGNMTIIDTAFGNLSPEQITVVDSLPTADATEYEKHLLYCYQNDLYFIYYDLDTTLYGYKKVGGDLTGAVTLSGAQTITGFKQFTSNSGVFISSYLRLGYSDSILGAFWYDKNRGYLYARSNDVQFGFKSASLFSHGVIQPTMILRNALGSQNWYLPAGPSNADIIVQEQLKKFTNVSASNWVSDNTYANYPYKCDITCTGITADSVVEVIFDMAEATSGDYAPICATSANTVTIYSKVDTAITIPVIKEV